MVLKKQRINTHISKFADVKNWKPLCFEKMNSVIYSLKENIDALLSYERTKQQLVNMQL